MGSANIKTLNINHLNISEGRNFQSMKAAPLVYSGYINREVHPWADLAKVAQLISQGC